MSFLRPTDTVRGRWNVADELNNRQVASVLEYISHNLSAGCVDRVSIALVFRQLHARRRLLLWSRGGVTWVLQISATITATNTPSIARCLPWVWPPRKAGLFASVAWKLANTLLHRVLQPVAPPYTCFTLLCIVAKFKQLLDPSRIVIFDTGLSNVIFLPLHPKTLQTVKRRVRNRARTGLGSGSFFSGILSWFLDAVRSHGKHRWRGTSLQEAACFCCLVQGQVGSVKCAAQRSLRSGAPPRTVEFLPVASGTKLCLSGLFAHVVKCGRHSNSKQMREYVCKNNFKRIWGAWRRNRRSYFGENLPCREKRSIHEQMLCSNRQRSPFFKSSGYAVANVTGFAIKAERRASRNLILWDAVASRWEKLTERDVFCDSPMLFLLSSHFSNICLWKAFSAESLTHPSTFTNLL